ncbi:MAG: septum formation initiator family protein [Candidatus Levybacteria bacterium]|nr:septum formation initiator family protein [Candidatus Levybacteria bacterium]
MKKVAYILIVIVSLYIVNNLVRSIYGLWQKQDLIIVAKDELKKEQNEQEKLKDELARVKRVDFIEEEARNKLFMGRPGEQVVILDKNASLKKTEKIEPIQPHWRQWLELIFGEK